MRMFFLILAFLLVNGIISFAYSVSTASDPTTLWAMFAVNFCFFLGITQTGIVFSAIMRIAKSEWSRYFNRLGEVLTLSFIPAAFIMFLVLYLGGAEHLFYWYSPDQAHDGHGTVHLSPWLDRDFFIWRYVVTMALFYFTSFIYFRGTRIEERGEQVLGYDLKKRMNVLAGFVMFFYVFANTNVAWDFGMMIIKHFESTIFPAYYWVGNVFAAPAFLFLLSHLFIAREPGEKLAANYLDSMGKLLLGFAMLWVYMFWSQHIVLWYADLPHLTKPVFKQMTGNFQGIFVVMLLAIFIIPFLALLFRRIKLSELSLTAVAVIICTGVWMNRYLMVVSVFSDGTTPVLATYTGVSLIFAGLAAVVLSLFFFNKVFPGISLQVWTDYEG